MTLATPDTTVITGAPVWLGTGLVAALADGEHERAGRLRLLVRDPSEVARVASSDRIEVVVGDVTNSDDVERLFADLHGDVDVIHTAGVIHPASMDEFDAVNHRGTENVLRNAERVGVRRVVHVSSNSPFGTNS